MNKKKLAAILAVLMSISVVVVLVATYGRSSEATKIIREETSNFPQQTARTGEDSDTAQRGVATSFSTWSITPEEASSVVKNTTFNNCGEYTCSQGFVDAKSIDFQGVYSSSSNSGREISAALERSKTAPYRCSYRIKGSFGIGSYKHLDMLCIDTESGQATYRHILR